MRDTPDYTFAHNVFHPLGCAHSAIQKNGSGFPIIQDSNGFAVPRLRFGITTTEGENKKNNIPLNNIATVRNYTIGRASDNMLVLADPTVSGHHAVIKLREGRLLIGDAGSSSGTVTDGISLKQDDCVVIHRNTSGRLGGLHFTITII